MLLDSHAMEGRNASTTNTDSRAGIRSSTRRAELPSHVSIIRKSSGGLWVASNTRRARLYTVMYTASHIQDCHSGRQKTES